LEVGARGQLLGKLLFKSWGVRLNSPPPPLGGGVTDLKQEAWSVVHLFRRHAAGAMAAVAGDGCRAVLAPPGPAANPPPHLAGALVSGIT